jgi:hypothetical protein
MLTLYAIGKKGKKEKGTKRRKQASILTLETAESD